jgi:hypothetical protein
MPLIELLDPHLQDAFFQPYLPLQQLDMVTGEQELVVRNYKLDRGGTERDRPLCGCESIDH